MQLPNIVSNIFWYAQWQREYSATSSVLVAETAESTTPSEFLYHVTTLPSRPLAIMPNIKGVNYLPIIQAPLPSVAQTSIKSATTNSGTYCEGLGEQGETKRKGLIASASLRYAEQKN